MSARRTVEYHPGYLMDVYGAGESGAVLLWHGRGPVERHLMAPIAALAARSGVLVMAPDWDSTQPDGGRAALQASLERARRLMEEHEVGGRGLVVAGWSLGGTTAASLALTDPASVRGAVCLAGNYLIPDPLVGERPIDLVGRGAVPPLRVLHGTDDEVVAVAGAHEFATRLAAAGPEVDVEEHPVDHAGIVMAEYQPELGACRPSRAPERVTAGTAAACAIVAVLG